MRKPLLVVCGVTAAVLLAGGVAATTAGADETPDQTAMPGLQFPGLPNFPQFPWMDGADAGGADTAGADTGDTGPVGAIGSHDRDATGGDQAGTNQTSGDNRFPDRPAAPASGQGKTANDGQHSTADDRTPQRPGGAGTDRQATDRQNAARPAAAQAPAAQAQKPASLTAAAQQEVSPAQVSTSAAAPFQQQVLALINENRRRGGCGSLTLDRRLIQAAFGHAADMARRDYFAHESPNGDGPGERVADAGFQWSRYGENIARGPSSAYEVVDGWMHSPEHRENIMDCRFREMGIGLAFGSDKESYWVQDFGTPRT
jgi:uncharacterized protein YkwD